MNWKSTKIKTRKLRENKIKKCIRDKIATSRNARAQTAVAGVDGREELETVFDSENSLQCSNMMNRNQALSG